MRIEALVNGKKMKLEVKKQYENNLGAVYECLTEDGSWVAVEERTVTKKITGVKTRFDYSGGEDRGIWVTIKANSEMDAEEAHEVLREIATKNGYWLSDCGNVEPNKGKWIIAEFIGVETPAEVKDVKSAIYETFKKAVA